MNETASEALILDATLPNLEAEGYDVFRHPPSTLLPHFMRSYSPDAIAVKTDKKLAIEIVRDDPNAHDELVRIQQLFQGHNDWELRVYWISQTSVSRHMEPSSIMAIDQALATIEKLLHQAMPHAALLLGWATLEAAARLLTPSALERPQPAAQLIQSLAFDGSITPDEADLLRPIGTMRDKVAHGDLTVAVTENQVHPIVSATRILLDQIPAS